MLSTECFITIISNFSSFFSSSLSSSPCGVQVHFLFSSLFLNRSVRHWLWIDMQIILFGLVFFSRFHSHSLRKTYVYFLNCSIKNWSTCFNMSHAILAIGERHFQLLKKKKWRSLLEWVSLLSKTVTCSLAFKKSRFRAIVHEMILIALSSVRWRSWKNRPHAEIHMSICVRYPRKRNCENVGTFEGQLKWQCMVSVSKRQLNKELRFVRTNTRIGFLWDYGDGTFFDICFHFGGDVLVAFFFRRIHFQIRNENFIFRTKSI